MIAICNRSSASAEAFAAEFGIPAVYSDVASMLAGARPDILDIITPPETHLAAIRAAATAGIDVICQKPFCTSLAEAQEAADIADAAGISVVVHENFRFQPWYRTIKQFLEQGLVGEVFQATFRLRPGDGQGPDAYLERQPYFQKMPRFLIHETAIHVVDVFRFLFGEAQTVFASLRKLNPAIAGEDSAVFVLNMASRTQCVFDGNRLSDHRAKNRRLTMGELTVEGSNGALSLDGDGGIWFRRHQSNDPERIEYQWNDVDFGGDCVYHLQRHVIDHRISGSRIENSARAYLPNLRIEEAIYASHHTGQRICIG